MPSPLSSHTMSPTRRAVTTARQFCKRVERTYFGSGEAFKDHANRMRRASRISTGERPAGRGVERSFAGWFRFTFGSADGGGERDLSGRLRLRRHGSQSSRMLKSTGTDSRRSKRRCKASRLHSGDGQNRTIVRPVLQRIVNLLCVPYIITSQTKKCLTACMRSYGNIVNTLRGLKAKVIP